MSKLPSTVKFASAFSDSPTAGARICTECGQNTELPLDWVGHLNAIQAGAPRQKKQITPTDVDLWCEVNNFFLIVESKFHSEFIQDGQKSALDALVRTGLLTVVYQIGKHDPTHWWYQDFTTRKSEIFESGFTPDRRGGSLYEFIKAWACKADNHKALTTWREHVIQAALTDRGFHQTEDKMIRWALEYVLERALNHSPQSRKWAKNLISKTANL